MGSPPPAPSPGHPMQDLADAVRAYAARYPEHAEDWPWGELAIKVRGRVYVFLFLAPDALKLTVKLPRSFQEALALPGVAPTGYGLGKSGWVTAALTADSPLPLELLQRWVDESWRAVAPKRLSASFPG